MTLLTFLPNILAVATTNANGPSVKMNPRIMETSGIFTVYVWGTFGGVSIKLQASPDGSEWFDIPDTTYTIKGIYNVICKAAYLRGVTTGGSGASVNVHAV